jgi:hypothetical protein
MGNRQPPQRRDESWWSLRLTNKDLATGGFEDRERGDEAQARDRLYKQNAYAALSPTRQLLWYGLLAGLQVGAAALAIETAALIALLAAALSVGQIGFANIYGLTPVSGTVFEPLWPVILSLPALPCFGLIGAIAALARRAGIRRRRILDRYFSPVTPRLDLAAFWALIFALLTIGAFATGVLTSQADPTGVLTLALCASGLIAWPSQRLWQLLYLPSIMAHGSASAEAIAARIKRQL